MVWDSDRDFYSESPGGFKMQENQFLAPIHKYFHFGYLLKF